MLSVAIRARAQDGNDADTGTTGLVLAGVVLCEGMASSDLHIYLPPSVLRNVLMDLAVERNAAHNGVTLP